MAGPTYAILERRGVLEIRGADARTFLQGLISNDVTKVAETRAVYSALLTPQGRFLHEFFVAALGDALLLDCEAERLDDLKRRLLLYKLRSKVEIADARDRFVVAALMGEAAPAKLGLPPDPGAGKRLDGGAAFVDPRLPQAGCRAIVARAGGQQAIETLGFARARPEDHERMRLALGLPDGSRDLEPEKAILLENGFDELHGIDWDKGCYMGQELTARTRYRGLVRKRLMPVEIAGPAPAPGTPVRLGDKEAGEMRTSLGSLGLAMIRLEALDEAGGAPFTAGDAKLTPRKPDWARFPAAEKTGA
jgi:folate-binding protein YgfZ